MKQILRTFMLLVACVALAAPVADAQRHQGAGAAGGQKREHHSQQARPAAGNSGSRVHGGRNERVKKEHGRPVQARPSMMNNATKDNKGRPAVGTGGNNSRPDRPNGNRPGNNKPGNNKPGNNKPGNNNRPEGVRPGGGNHGGNHGGNNVGNHRPGVGNKPGNGNNRPGHGNNGNNHRPGNNHNRPGGNHAVKPGNGHAPGFGPSAGHHRPPTMRPPQRPHRPPMLRPHYRPVPPPAWRPRRGLPFVRGILGLTFGAAINVSLDYLYNNGYTVDGYGNDIVYLRNVPALNYIWTDAALYYGAGGLDTSSFYYSTPYYDAARYNSVYNSLVGTYGYPVSTGNSGGVVTSTWFGGNNGFITLSFGAGSAGRFLTTLTFGM